MTTTGQTGLKNSFFGFKGVIKCGQLLKKENVTFQTIPIFSNICDENAKNLEN